MFNHSFLMPYTVNQTYRMTTRIGWVISLICFLVMIGTMTAYAQAVLPITHDVSNIYRTFKSLAKVVSAVCAIIGSIKVFGKFTNGDPSVDVKRSILIWFGGCFFSLLIFGLVDTLFR